MNRREAVAAGLGALATTVVAGSNAPDLEDKRSPSPNEQQWRKLDAQVRKWWDQDLIDASEATLRSPQGAERLFLPFPYLRISATPGGTYEGQFPFDTAFKNYALLAHDRADIVRYHLLNHLFMIERHGFAPNANLTGLLTRSQTPFVPATLWRYYTKTRDLDLLYRAYPALKHEYRHYWNASHHQTPIGLATNRDLGDAVLSAELASAAELLDWMPVFNGDIRRCVPVGTNCVLVTYARVLSLIAKEIGRNDEAREFNKEADRRTALIHRYCWNEKAGQFLEYDYVAEQQLPYVSEFSYWPLWAGVATRSQAARLAGNLHLLEKPHGIACTDKEYPDPHPEAAYALRGGVIYKRLQDVPPAKDAPPEYVGGKGQLMWAYPAGWGTTQIIVTAGLDAYGYGDASRRLSGKFLQLLLDQYAKTGQLWEKYNVVDGSLILPNARYGNIPYHSFTAAAVVVLGQRYFEDRQLQVM
jgi:alpha,alpha-trehalase